MLLQGGQGTVSSAEGQQQSRQSEGGGAYSSLYRSGAVGGESSSSVAVGYYALQRENAFPERAGQPECQFYMKTGDCKFGAVCRFHHPRERLVPAPDCVLSAIGLPLRPGEPLCIFYSRYGICKFGPSCKFDHPMGVFTYNQSASSSPDAPAVRHLLASSSSSTGALSLTSEGLVDSSAAGAGGGGPVKLRRLSLPETNSTTSTPLPPPTRQVMPSVDNINNVGTE